MNTQAYRTQLQLEQATTAATISHLAQFKSQDELSMQRQLQVKQGRIDNALQRLEDGEYGRCMNCGAEIDPERLQVLPYTELCVNCQRQLERKILGQRHRQPVQIQTSNLGEVQAVLTLH